MTDAVPHMGQVSLLCPNLCVGYLHRPGHWQTKNVNVGECSQICLPYMWTPTPLCIARGENVHNNPVLYTCVIETAKLCSQKQEQGFEKLTCKKIENYYWMVLCSRGLSTTGICTWSSILLPSIGHYLLSSKSEAAFTRRPSLTVLFWDTYLSQSPGSLDTNS